MDVTTIPAKNPDSTRRKNYPTSFIIVRGCIELILVTLRNDLITIYDCDLCPTNSLSLHPLSPTPSDAVDSGRV